MLGHHGRVFWAHAGFGDGRGERWLGGVDRLRVQCAIGECPREAGAERGQE